MHKIVSKIVQHVLAAQATTSIRHMNGMNLATHAHNAAVLMLARTLHELRMMVCIEPMSSPHSSDNPGKLCMPYSGPLAWHAPP
jgi:hypothetical protein